jgi:hypothetical protein
MTNPTGEASTPLRPEGGAEVLVRPNRPGPGPLANRAADRSTDRTADQSTDRAADRTVDRARTERSDRVHYHAEDNDQSQDEKPVLQAFEARNAPTSNAGTSGREGTSVVRVRF